MPNEPRILSPDQLQFQDAPPENIKTSNGSKYRPVLDQLMKHPGQWTIIAVVRNQSNVQSIRKTAGPNFIFKTQKIGPEDFNIWGCYEPKEPIEPHRVPQQSAEPYDEPVPGVRGPRDVPPPSQPR